jgi:agmatine/peptidylarginine deiminase
MKSEERITELLAEYLLKADQLIDSMDRTDHSVDIMSRAIAANDIKFIAQNEKFNSMNEKFNVVNQEIKQLREEQGVMLRELVSLSKRVAVVEEKH